jgi:hypothetical protein
MLTKQNTSGNTNWHKFCELMPLTVSLSVDVNFKHIAFNMEVLAQDKRILDALCKISPPVGLVLKL